MFERRRRYRASGVSFEQGWYARSCDVNWEDGAGKIDEQDDDSGYFDRGIR